MVVQLDREQLVEGMTAMGLNPDNPEAVAAYQEWLVCDPAPYNPPGAAQRRAYDRMMRFAQPSMEQGCIEEEWGNWPVAVQAGQGTQRQRQRDTERE